MIKALQESRGGETFISKIPSFKVTDLAEAMLPGCEKPEVGIREGEKLHEIMVTTEDALTAYEYDKHYIVYPQMSFWNGKKVIPGGHRLEYGFSYTSGNNSEWYDVEDLKRLLKEQYYSKKAD